MAFLWFLDFSTILIFLVVFLLAYWVLRTHNKNLPPGPRPLPFCGTILEIPKARKMGQNDYMKSLAEKYGPITMLWLGMKPCIILHSIDLVKEALVDKQNIFSFRPKAFNLDTIKERQQEKGLINANETSKEIRRHTLISMRDFGLGKRSLEERIQTEADYLVTEISKQEGKPFDLKTVLTNAVSNIICHLTLGSRFDYNDPTFDKQLGNLGYVATNKQVVMDPALYMPWLYYILPRKVLALTLGVFDFLMKKLQEHRDSFDAENIRDLMDLFIQGQAENKDCGIFDDGNLRATVMDLFLAGTETSSSTLKWTILYLLKHPEIQERCQQHIDREVGRSRAPCLSDRPKLTYITAVLQEVQRMASIVPIGLPHCTSAETTLGQYYIPKDTIVFYNLLTIHYDPAHWEDPEDFKPERWLDDKGNLIKHDAYMPFGLGPRTCLGEPLANTELFLFLTTLLQHLTFLKETPDMELDLEGLTGATHVPKPYKVRAVER